MESFYASVPEPRVQREAYDRHAKSQEARVLEWFRERPELAASREDIERRFNFPTQTASRVLANLTKRGQLEKTGARVQSSMRRTANTWRLRRALPAAAPAMPTVQEALL